MRLLAAVDLRRCPIAGTSEGTALHFCLHNQIGELFATLGRKAPRCSAGPWPVMSSGKLFLAPERSEVDLLSKPSAVLRAVASATLRASPMAMDEVVLRARVAGSDCLGTGRLRPPPPSRCPSGGRGTGHGRCIKDAL